MNVQEQIDSHINSLAEPKRSEIQTLHELILRISPASRLWFFDGTNEEGKTITNPTIGYGQQTMHYANGKTKVFFRVGILANKTGISVHILGIEDKTFLAQTFGTKLGKASVTGYCIKFNTLNDIHMDTLEAAIRYGLSLQDV